ncbi:hypothetical protein [Novosphingobium mangrovi (ex Huang et al. 2023)]|uniref:Lipoprotein n=1 Tax=Novosphingobium mangrovi (ex Huang et al. 2023) TaxID=2976432 RepID=A0ABT2I0Y9_9SPHN|nr:hypothetical protein [Novosphingobium mangrovi (ex Huang et al. 2023)]MCT2398262.1 hypothetical protein [Novosphingobium mangrovi (ex Huang et al. 2023)]
MKTPAGFGAGFGARFVVLGLAGTLMLAGCGSSDKAPTGGETDPAMSGALGDQIMVDPEMAGEDGAALAANGSQITLPPEDRSPDAIKAAKAKAAELMGGKLLSLPQPAKGGAAALSESAATAAQIAKASKIAHTDCAAKAEYSNTWAAKLPADIPVYPRGAVQEAAGVDSSDCALRVVSFATAVKPEDVIGFYYTNAEKTGYGAEYKLDGNDHVLGGRKDGKAYVVYARKAQGGITEVDLVTSGK